MRSMASTVALVTVVSVTWIRFHRRRCVLVEPDDRIGAALVQDQVTARERVARIDCEIRERCPIIHRMNCESNIRSPATTFALVTVASVIRELAPPF